MEYYKPFSRSVKDKNDRGGEEGRRGVNNNEDDGMMKKQRASLHVILNAVEFKSQQCLKHGVKDLQTMRASRTRDVTCGKHEDK
jgi:hypothetical protein